MHRLALLLLASSALPADWPQFRGPSGSGLGSGNPPLHWNGETGRNILWKTPIPGLGHSSPVVWRDRIFLTSAVPVSGSSPLKLGLYGDIEPVENEGAQRYNVYCLDRRTGKILWTRTAVEAIPKVKRHPKSTHANPTPATDGERLIVSFGSEGLFAYDFDGALLWKKDLGILDAGFFRVPSAQWGYSSSPVLHNSRVLIQADVQKGSFLAAFDAKTGRELWRAARGDVPTFGTPAVAPYSAGQKQALQVVVNGWKHIGGYSLDDGRELWRLSGGGDIPVPTPIVSGDLILITSAHGSDRPIYAIRTSAAGEIAPGSPALAWKQDRAGNYMQTPLALDGLGYFCTDNGVLSVYRLSTGERLYQQRLGGGTSGFSSSPVSAAGRFYLTSEDGVTHVLEAGAEFRRLAQNELGETVMATPALSAGVLYIRGRSHLYAIGAR